MVLAFFLGALTSVVHPSRASAQNWPAWRGPYGTGVSDAKDVKDPPLKWTEKQNVRWRVELPDRGNSTPIVWGDRVFVTQAIEKENRRTLMCFGRTDGKLLWQSGVVYAERESTNGQNPYCSASPVTDGSRVVAYFGSAGIYCYDFDGKEIWHHDLGKADSWHGSGSSPVLYEDLCIINAGPGTNAALVALNKMTGDEAWKVSSKNAAPALMGLFGLLGARGGAKAAPDAGGAGTKFDSAAAAVDMSGAGGFAGSWSTPLIVKVADEGKAPDELIVPLTSKLAGYDPATGKELWTCRGMTEQVFSSPTASNGVLIVAAKVGGGGTLVFAVKLGGKGDITQTHLLWQERLPKDCVGSPVIAGGNAYMVTQFGTIVCLEVSTGKKLAEKRLSSEASVGGSWSSIVLVANKLLVPNQSGEVFIVKPTPELEILATNSVGEEPTCASLAVADGQVFLRTYKALWCFANPL
ncbi:MAG TPA: PQQ-binding-like beta-propeller repeat protein [Humisphaera sp.]|nr:PQQ-binding-like beta-propeller repeat protein [Humisphaera sp.]